MNYRSLIIPAAFVAAGFLGSCERDNHRTIHLEPKPFVQQEYSSDSPDERAEDYLMQDMDETQNDGVQTAEVELEDSNIQQEYSSDLPDESTIETERHKMPLDNFIVYSIGLSLERARQGELPLHDVFENISGQHGEGQTHEFFQYADSPMGKISLKLEGTTYDNNVYSETIGFWDENGKRLGERTYSFKVYGILKDVLDRDERGLQRSGVVLRLKDITGKYSLLENLTALLDNNGGDISCFERTFGEYMAVQERKEKSVSGFNSYVDSKLEDAEITALKLLGILDKHSGGEAKNFGEMVDDLYAETLRGEIDTDGTFTRMISDFEYEGILEKFATDYGLEREDFVNLQFALINLFELEASKDNESTNLEEYEKNVEDLKEKKKTNESNIQTYQGEINRAHARSEERRGRRRYLIAGPHDRKAGPEEQEYLRNLMNDRRTKIGQTRQEIQQVESETEQTASDIEETQSEIGRIEERIKEETTNKEERERSLEENDSISMLEFFIRSEHRNEYVRAYLEKRFINADEPWRVLEIYNLVWENRESTEPDIRVPYERVLDEYQGRLIASDPGLLDRMGISLQSFGENQERKIEGFQHLIQALNKIDQYGLRHRVKEIMQETMRYIDSMNTLDKMVEGVERKPDGELLPAEDVPPVLRDIFTPDKIDKYRSLDRENMMELERRLRMTDNPVERVGRMIGAALYKSGYFNMEERITPDNKRSWLIDANEIDGIPQSLSDSIYEAIEAFIEKGDDPERFELLKERFLYPLKDQEEIIPEWKGPDD